MQNGDSGEFPGLPLRSPEQKPFQRRHSLLRRLVKQVTTSRLVRMTPRPDRGGRGSKDTDRTPFGGMAVATRSDSEKCWLRTDNSTVPCKTSKKTNFQTTPRQRTPKKRQDIARWRLFWVLHNHAPTNVSQDNSFEAFRLRCSPVGLNRG